MRRQIRIERIGVAALWLVLAIPARAEPLPAETCATLKSEQETLAAAGVATDMAKGPAWAKGNLPRERLVQISRYISLEEQMLFRCGLAKLKSTLPPEVEEAPAQPAAAAPEQAPVPPKQKPKPKAAAATPAPEAVPSAKPEVRRPPAPKAAETSPPAETTVKPKIIKPKVDDAYRPPAASPSADPFAKQVAPAKQ